MNLTLQIEAKLVGPDKTKRRRADMVADLTRAFAEGNSDAVTVEMTKRMESLTDAFEDELQELKKKL